MNLKLPLWLLCLPVCFIVAYLFRELKTEPGGDCGKLFEWTNPIGKQILTSSTDPQTSFTLDDTFVPVTAFNRPVGYEYISSLRESHVFALELDCVELPKNKIDHIKYAYMAQIVKLAGYRAIWTWLPTQTPVVKEVYPLKFTENIGSARVSDLSALQSELTLHPPKDLLQRTIAHCGVTNVQQLQKVFMEQEPTVDTVPGIRYMQRGIARQSNLEKGQRLELFWFNNPRIVRPATVVEVVGRRVRVQVEVEESMELFAEDRQEGDKDRQFGPSSSFWVDEGSFYLVHVGWAMLNDYTLIANKEYTNHSRRIAESLRNDEVPDCESYDVTRWQLTQCREQFLKPKINMNLWKIGMKCELLDPLNGNLTILSVATLKRKLEDGYLEFWLDSYDGSNDTVALHYTSTRLFPLGYSEKNGIALSLDDTETGEKFHWNSVPYQEWAPEELFIRDEPNRIEKFKVGAYLEAFSLKEHHMCHPGKIVSVHGRLLRIQFVGWESNEDNDELYDIYSRDILPVGWCEMHGFRLELGENKTI